MAEKVKNAAPDQEFNDDGTKNPDFVPQKKEGEGGDTDSKNKGADDKDKDKDKDEEDKGGGKDFDDEAAPVVPVRKSVEQHIIARKDKKIKKLESQLKEGDEGYVPPDDEDEEDGLTDEARGAVSKEVDKKIAPILKQMISDADENELKSLFATEPEAKKYEKHIRAYMGHDAYKGVAPSVIFHHLAFSNAQATGAKKREVADLEAKQNKGGGRKIAPKGGVGDLPSAEEIADMSEAEFEKMEQDARQGKFVNK